MSPLTSKLNLLIARYRHLTATKKAAVYGKTSQSACSSSSAFTTWDDSFTRNSTPVPTSGSTTWDDSSTWNSTPVQTSGSTNWDDSSTWNSTPVQTSGSTTWDDSSAWNFTPAPPSGSTTWDDSCAASAETLTTPFSADPKHIASGTPLDLSAAVKHELAVYLKRTVEVSCFAFLTAQAPWILELLRLDEYDTIDINVYIILIGYLRSTHHISSKAFAASTSWPDIKSFCTEKASPRDNIGRLRQVAVHRWNYNTHLIRDVIDFLALLKDDDRIAEIEDILHRLPDQGVAAIPPPTCATRSELLATIVRILERNLYIQAREHCPSVLATNDHEHTKELSHLAETVLSSLPSSSSASAIDIQEAISICRNLRNSAAHHNSFTAEAIQSRKDGGSVTCRYDAYPDPYAALAKDAERVAMMAGDEGAVGEIRLAVWAANTSVSNRARKQSDSAADHEAQYYSDLARKADLEKSRLNGEDARGWEAVRTLYMRYSESTEYFEKRAIEARGESGKWAEDVVRDL